MSDDLAAALGAAASAVDSMVTLRKWNAVAYWSFGERDAVCAVCRNQLDEVCIHCAVTSDSVALDACSILWGVCNHAYHAHCIVKFLKQSRDMCPLDGSTFIVARTGR